MSDMKCPFCQQELEKRHASTTDYNSMFITYYCGNPECESTTDLIGCKEFWDILGQLSKALNFAISTLTVISEGLVIEHSVVGHEDDNKIKLAKIALDKIKTALEQKD